MLVLQSWHKSIGLVLRGCVTEKAKCSEAISSVVVFLKPLRNYKDLDTIFSVNKISFPTSSASAPHSRPQSKAQPNSQFPKSWCCWCSKKSIHYITKSLACCLVNFFSACKKRENAHYWVEDLLKKANFVQSGFFLHQSLNVKSFLVCLNLLKKLENYEPAAKKISLDYVFQTSFAGLKTCLISSQDRQSVKETLMKLVLPKLVFMKNLKNSIEYSTKELMSSRLKWALQNRRSATGLFLRTFNYCMRKKKTGIWDWIDALLLLLWMLLLQAKLHFENLIPKLR